MELETKRLLLRPLRDDDASAIARDLKPYDIAKYLARVAHPYTLQDAKTFIQLQRSFTVNSKLCAIAFKCAPDELLGIVSYEYSAEKQKTEFGYWLSESCWGQRIMSEAAKALVNHAFTKGEVEALHAGYWNPISGRLLAKLGFTATHESLSFCLAQNMKVPSQKVRLTIDEWRAAQ